MGPSSARWSMSEARAPRVIKRYANRKLYDMSQSCYVTHDEIARLVKEGEDVRIIDNRTKEDLTSLTLTQILWNEEKRQKKSLPLEKLRDMLQTGGDFIQRRIAEPVTSIRQEAEDAVRKVSAAFRREEPEREPAPPEAHAAERPRPPDALREWLDHTQRSFENLQKNLEDRIGLVTNTVGLLDQNRRKIADLEHRVAELEAEVRRLRASGERDLGGNP